MLGAPRIPDFKIPNSEFCMAYGPVREILARGRRGRTSSVSPGRTLGVRWGGRNLAPGVGLTGKEGRKGTEWTPDPGKEKPLGGT
jgi:hypothetical protein